MSRLRSRALRGGFLMVPVLVTSFIIIMFTVVMARLAVLEFARERQAQLETCVDQVVASAAAWSRLHAAELRDDATVKLPLADVLPAGMSGAAELRRVDGKGGGALVECQITIERAGRRLVRRVEWPSEALRRPQGADATVPRDRRPS